MVGANPGRFFALVTIGLNNFDLNIKKTECRLRYQETVLGCLKKIWPGKDALFALDSHWDKVDKPFSKCAFVIGFIFFEHFTLEFLSLIKFIQLLSVNAKDVELLQAIF